MRSTKLLKIVQLLMCVALAGVACLKPASATHFRYGNMNWAPTGAPGQVVFHVTCAFERDRYSGSAADGEPQTGDIIAEDIGGSSLDYGDGNNSGEFNILVEAYSPTENWFEGEVLDPTTNQPGVLHSYQGAGPFTAQINSCCRILELNNRSSDSYIMSTTVLPLAGISSPVSSLVPIVYVADSPTASFFVPGVDPNSGHTLNFRFATDLESTGDPTPSQPPAMTIDSGTGKITWNTTGLDKTSLWTQQVIIEDRAPGGQVITQTPIDFLMKIVTAGTAFPAVSINPAGPLTVSVGSTITLAVNGTESGTGVTLTLNTSGIPADAHVRPALPVSGPSGISAIMTWTPTAADVGPHVLLFTATDNSGVQAQSSILVTVIFTAGASNLLATAVTDTEIDLQWTSLAAPSRTGFRIFRSQGGGPFTDLGDVGTDATTYQDTGLQTDVTYTYYVVATSDVGQSNPSNQSSDTTYSHAPLAPATLSATAVSKTQVNLAWVDNNNDVSRFIVERQQGSGAFVPVITLPATARGYSDGLLNQNTAYTYQIVATNVSGTSPSSNLAPVTTFSDPPIAPANLTAVAASQTAVNLGWTDTAGDAATYTLFRLSATGAILSSITIPGTQNQFQDTGLQPNTSYSYQIQANNAAGASGGSNIVSVATDPGPPAAAPVGLTAKAASGFEVDLAWSDSAADFTGFQIERQQAGGAFVVVGATPAGTTTFTDSTVQPASSYTYRIQATNAGGTGPASAQAKVTTPSIPPGVPTGITAVAISQTRVDLTWKVADASATGFKIQRETGSGAFTTIAQTAAGASSYSDLSASGGTTYTYEIVAINASGASSPSSGATVTTPPNPPTSPLNFTASSVSQTGVILTWSAGSGTQQFILQRKTGSGTYRLLATLSASTTTYADAGLTPSTPYTYSLTATSSAGSSSPDTLTVTTAPTRPAAPVQLTAAAASRTEIDLTWVPSGTTQAGFTLQRRTASTSFSTIASLSAPTRSYQDLSVAAGTTYTYQIFAFNSGGASGPSNLAAATTPVNPPAAPVLVSATASSAGSVTLVWKAGDASQTGFTIQRLQAGSWINVGQVGASVLTFVNSGLTASTSFSYRIGAANAGGASGYSNVLVVTTLPATPSVPTNLTAKATSNSQITLSWTPGSHNQTGFKIERQTGGGSFVQIALTTASATSYVDSGLVASTTYTYRLRATNSGGDSAYSSSASATTSGLPSAPTRLAPEALTSSQVKLTWVASATAGAGYDLERQVGNGTFAVLALLPANTTSYLDTTATASTALSYRIRATTPGGDSAYDGPFTVDTPASPATVPASPTLVSAVGMAGGVVKLTWSSNSPGVTGYVIQRRTGSGPFGQIAVTAGTVTSLTNKGLTPKTAFTYRILAENAVGSSAFSNEVAVTTP